MSTNVSRAMQLSKAGRAIKTNRLPLARTVPGLSKKSYPQHPSHSKAADGMPMATAANQPTAQVHPVRVQAVQQTVPAVPAKAIPVATSKTVPAPAVSALHPALHPAPDNRSAINKSQRRSTTIASP